MDINRQQRCVLIEFSDRDGLRQVASTRSADIVQKSATALRDAMGLIVDVAAQVHDTVESMGERPSRLDISFGIKFDAEASALIAKAQAEASMTVTMEWNDASDS
jgi:hypothetical protein